MKRMLFTFALILAGAIATSDYPNGGQSDCSSGICSLCGDPYDAQVGYKCYLYGGGFCCTEVLTTWKCDCFLATCTGWTRNWWRTNWGSCPSQGADQQCTDPG